MDYFVSCNILHLKKQKLNFMAFGPAIKKKET